jgi:hypothetical protein
MKLYKIKRSKNIWERLSDSDRLQRIKILTKQKTINYKTRRINEIFKKYVKNYRYIKRIEHLFSPNTDEKKKIQIILDDPLVIPIVDNKNLENTISISIKIKLIIENNLIYKKSGFINYLTSAIWENPENRIKKIKEINELFLISTEGFKILKNPISIFKWHMIYFDPIEEFIDIKKYDHEKYQTDIFKIENEEITNEIDFNYESYEITFDDDLYLIVKKIMKTNAFIGLSSYDNVITIQIIISKIYQLRERLSENIKNKKFFVPDEDINVLIYFSWILTKLIDNDITVNIESLYYKKIKKNEDTIFDIKFNFVYNIFYDIYNKEFNRIKKNISDSTIKNIIIWLWKIQKKKIEKKNILKYNEYIINDLNKINFTEFISLKENEFKINVEAEKIKLKYKFKKRFKIMDQSGTPKKILKIDKIDKIKKIKIEPLIIEKKDIIDLIIHLKKFINPQKIDNLNLINFYNLDSANEEWKLKYGIKKNLFKSLKNFTIDNKSSLIVYNFLKFHQNFYKILNINIKDIKDIRLKEIETKKYRYEIYYDLTPEEKIELNAITDFNEKQERLDMLIDIKNLPNITRIDSEDDINEHDEFYN